MSKLNNWGNYTQSHYVERPSATGVPMIIFYSYNTPVLVSFPAIGMIVTTEKKFSQTTAHQKSRFMRYLFRNYGIGHTYYENHDSFVQYLDSLDIEKTGWL